MSESEVSSESGSEPRVFVGCEGCYNNGHLHGRWLTLEQICEEMVAWDQRDTDDEPILRYGGIARWQAGAYGTSGAFICERCGADEFAITDCEILSAKFNLREVYEQADTLLDTWYHDEEGFWGLMLLAEYGIAHSLDDLISWDEENRLMTAHDEDEIWEHLRDEVILSEHSDVEILGRSLSEWIPSDAVADWLSGEILILESADGLHHSWWNH